MTRTWFVAPAVALIVGVAASSPARALPAPAEPEIYGQQYGWDVPPQEYNEVQRRGFHDGVQGAQKDYGNNRRPNVNNREEYRDPDDMPHDIPPQLRDAYRDAFRRGYAVGASHLWGARAPAPYYPPQQQNWDWGMRGLRSDVERRGYSEGIEEARRDYQERRRIDPDDHHEYRNPPVPPPMAGEYREGFMRGYTVAMSQLSGESEWRFEGDPSTWAAPNAWSEMERRGFRDGIDGARKDYGNSRYPDPNNRDEYRDPHVPSQFRFEYRQGFRRGYERAAASLWGNR